MYVCVWLQRKSERIGGIKGLDLCPSINQGPIRARTNIENPGDPIAPISSGDPQALTVREAAGPPLHRLYHLIAGDFSV